MRISTTPVENVSGEFSRVMQVDADKVENLIADVGPANVATYLEF